MLTTLIVLLCIALFVFLATVSAPILRLWAQEPIGMAVPLLACVIVLAAPQMADMMAGMKSAYGTGIQDVGWWHEIGLGAGVFMLGLQGWFWTRAALNARFGWRDVDAPVNMDWPKRWAPRLTLLPTTLIAVSPLFMATFHHIPWSSVPWMGVVSAAVACLIVGCGAWYRRKGQQAVRDMAAGLAARLVAQLPAQQPAVLAPPGWPRMAQLFAGGPGGSPARRALLLAGMQRIGTPTLGRALPRHRVQRLFAAAPIGGAVTAWVLLVAALVGIVVAQLAPDFINNNLPTPTAAFLAMSCVVPVAAIMLALCRDVVEGALSWMRGWLTAAQVELRDVADLLGLLLLIAIPIGGSYAAQCLGWYDVSLPHPSSASGRPVPDSAALVNKRPGIEQAVSGYLDCHPKETGKVPAIIVASEGGASRSAVWTLSVMRMLDARTGGAFGAHLFAVTSVSGGSLAAVTYDLAQATYLPSSASAPTLADQMAFWDRAVPGLVELGRGDLLSSSIARMFTSDLLLGVPRRGPALARAFEHNWGRPNGFALGDYAERGLLAARDGHGCLPHLLLNGTDVDTGDRLLTSSVKFADHPELFPSAMDVLDGQQTDIPGSAAVLNSARFPMISPPGQLPANSYHQPRDLMVIDGGVFENYGARTAWEFVDALRASPQAQRLEPIVVLISNDSDEAPETCQAETATAADEPNPKDPTALKPGQTSGGIGVPEFLTSLLGLYNTRGAHGRGEIGMLRRLLCDASPGSPEHLFHFDLPAPLVSLEQSAPMNWVLDANSCTFMLGAARTGSVNPEQANALRARLVASGVAAADMGDKAAEDSVRCEQPGGPLPSSHTATVASRP